jgi:hypothetical protein
LAVLPATPDYITELLWNSLFRDINLSCGCAIANRAEPKLNRVEIHALHDDQIISITIR